MAKNLLTYLNKVLGMVIGALGLTGCVAVKYGVPEAVAMYGCPVASFAAEGTVTNEQGMPIKGVKVTAGERQALSGDGLTVRDTVGTFPVGLTAGETPASPVNQALTDEQGQYRITIDAMFPADSIWLYADDSTGVYASDSARVKIAYESNGDGMWDMGDGKAEADFRLKRPTPTLPTKGGSK
ncbi:MAG: radical SAM-associated putative lipoprotein [Paludibacteraceae bacterium]